METTKYRVSDNILQFHKRKPGVTRVGTILNVRPSNNDVFYNIQWEDDDWTYEHDESEVGVWRENFLMEEAKMPREYIVNVGDLVITNEGHVAVVIDKTPKDDTILFTVAIPPNGKKIPYTRYRILKMRETYLNESRISNRNASI